MEFINSIGEAVHIEPENAQVVESNPQYTVYSARHNPSGEQLTSVVYNHGTDEVTSIEAADAEEQFVDDAIDANESYDPFSNPGGTLFNWRNLRLQGAITSEGKVKKATRSLFNVLRAAKREIPAGQSIRDNDSLLKITTGDDWYKYVQNLKKSPVDLGAEYSADVSKSQRASVALFLMEWDQDPGHVDLQRRISHGADLADVKYKGQLAYDVMTGRWSALQAAGYGNLKYDKMYRLAFDIIRSMPLNTYNYYTVNEMHVHEGDRVYADFRSRYIPLESYEVEVVSEIQHEFSSKGSAYAFQTTASESVGLEAARLMKMLIATYNVGDTRTVRAIINQLTEAPFNYRPQSQKAGSKFRRVTESGRAETGSKGKEAIRYVMFKVQVNQSNTQFNDVSFGWQDHVQKAGPFYGAFAIGLADKDITNDNQIKTGNQAPKSFVIVKGADDRTMMIYATRTGKDYTLSPYKATIAEQAKLATGKEYSRAGKNIHSGLKNPVKGWVRGKYLYVQIHPKNQLKMKKQSPKSGASGPAKGDTLHGDKSKKGMGYWSRGLNKHFPKLFMVQVGTLKKTGEEAPWMIRLPKTHFKRAMDHKTGIISIKPKSKKLEAKMGPEWKKFIDFYGLPKHSPTRDIHHKWNISKKHRGTYFDKLRRTVGQMKA